MHKSLGFSLLELAIVIVIIGILATFGIAQYRSAQERALDKQAQANLRLILAAERVWRLDDNNSPPQYIACGSTVVCNSALGLLLPTANPSWAYRVNVQAIGNNPAQAFAAQATRTQTPERFWCLREPTAEVPDPQPTPGACPF